MTAIGGATTPKDKPSRWRCRWTEAEDAVLAWNWGNGSILSIAKKLNRTNAGVVMRAKLLGLGGLNRGKIGLKALARKLGYDPRSILTAAKRAGIPLLRRRLPTTNLKKIGKRVRRGRNFGFDDDDIELIIAELNSASNPNYIKETIEGEWGTGTKPDACLDCKTTEKPHWSRGLCRACSGKRRRKNDFTDRPPIKRGTVKKKGR